MGGVGGVGGVDVVAGERREEDLSNDLFIFFDV